MASTFLDELYDCNPEWVSKWLKYFISSSAYVRHKELAVSTTNEASFIPGVLNESSEPVTTEGMETLLKYSTAEMSRAYNEIVRNPTASFAVVDTKTDPQDNTGGANHFGVHSSASSAVETASVAPRSLLDTYRLTPAHIVIEGIDFHCDLDLITSILSSSTCMDALTEVYLRERSNLTGGGGGGSVDASEENVPGYGVQPPVEIKPDTIREDLEGICKSCIWQFRSSLNRHQAWPLLSPVEQQCLDAHTAQTLQKKKQLAPYWKVICPVLNAYCAARRAEMESRLVRFYRK
jgi:hypothetical protein